MSYNPKQNSTYAERKPHLGRVWPLRHDSAKLDIIRFTKRVEEVLEKSVNSPVKLGDVFGQRTLTGFNSHGAWSTLEAIRKIEKEERGNPFPSLRFPDDTPAIWICLTKRKALRYIEDADQWDRLDGASRLTKEDKEMMRDIEEITLRPSDVCAFTDGDSGYLILRPKTKEPR